MAEAIAVLGLAASVLQFVDFGSRVASNFRKFYNSHHQDREDVPDLQRINTNLQQILRDLQVPKAGCFEDTGLVELANDCQAVASELDRLLKSLFKADTESHGKLEAFKASFKLMWKEKGLRSLQERIDHFRNQLVVHLLTTLREQIHKSLVQQQEILDQLKAASDSSKLASGAHPDTFGDDGFGTRVLTLLSSKIERGLQEDQLVRLKEDLTTAIRANGQADDNEAHLQRPMISETRRLRLHRIFLHKLSYDGMEDREAKIPQAYESTFQWIWEPPSGSERTWSSFVHWLGSDSQLYWITGKAGSGKSTLMKYVSSTKTNVPDRSGPFKPTQSDYRTYLNRWAKGSKLIVAVFFFWNSGLNLQMTQTGLFRSLLYQIVQQAPELLPVAFAKQWEAACLFGAEFVCTDQQLQYGLQCVVKNLDSNQKLCMFVDGLDEFAGDPNVLIALFQKLTTNSCVKLCVASRPWLAFEDAFRDKPSLMLEDLTYIDIRHYVSSNFYGDPGFSRLQCLEPDFAEQLVENIVTKSSGVFLWVHLVITSLLSGLEYGDRVIDIQRRLDILPTELEQLFDKILSSLDPFYLEHAAQLFELVKCCPSPPSAVLLAYADEAGDIQKVIERPICTRTLEETDALVESMRRRLNSRCKGFLEITRSIQSSTNDTAVKLVHEQRTVQYLHRTVKDYIESGTVQEKLRSAMKAAFNPCVQLCAGYLRLIKTMDTSNITLLECDPAWNCVQNLLMVANAVPSTHSQETIHLMDDLDRTCVTIGQIVAKQQQDLARGSISNKSDFFYPLRNGHWVEVFPRRRDIGECSERYTAPRWNQSWSGFGNHFVSLAIGFGVTAYVQHKVNNGCLIQLTTTFGHASESFDLNKIKKHPGPDQKWPLLLDAIKLLEDPNRDMVQCLLDKGADPNATIPDRTGTDTVWKLVLDEAKTLGPQRDCRRIYAWLDIVTMMIEKGGGNYTPKQKEIILAGVRHIAGVNKLLVTSLFRNFCADLEKLDPGLSRQGFLTEKQIFEQFRRNWGY
ncbi:MAG: hypothetical protein M1821_004428 [Bathelium mastoideum]|nr:MAG: hypothetical protein M1821_004428 [Bathelium mastoideum]